MKYALVSSVFALAIAACGAPVVPPVDAARDREGPVDANASDAAMDSMLTDADVLACANNSECPANMICQFQEGCGQVRGVCTDQSCLSLPVVLQYCSCDGRTLQAGGCRPDQPFRSMGACADGGSDASADAAMSFACGTSQCDPSTQFCEGPRGPGACPRLDAGPCPAGCPGCPALPPPSCSPIPAACAANPTCECVSRALCGSAAGARCEGTSSTGLRVTCLSA